MTDTPTTEVALVDVLGAERYALGAFLAATGA
jgi:hypothetical protein